MGNTKQFTSNGKCQAHPYDSLAESRKKGGYSASIYIYILVMGRLDDYSLIVDQLIGFFGILTDRLGFSIIRKSSINRD